ncbi:MAG: histidine kinase [Prolixibacteraceae bacterium]
MYRIILLLLVIPFCGHTQPHIIKQYTYKQYTTYDGLAQSQVTNLYQCSKGYLWICTKEGISRFDGQRFKNFGGDGLDQFNSVYEIFEYQNFYYLCEGNTLYQYKGANLKLTKSFTLPDGYGFSPQSIHELHGNSLFLFNLYLKNSPPHTYGHLTVNLSTKNIEHLTIPQKKLFAFTQRHGFQYFIFQDNYVRKNLNHETFSALFEEKYHNIWSFNRDTIYGITKDNHKINILNFKNDSIVVQATEQQLHPDYAYLNQAIKPGTPLTRLVYFDKKFNLYSFKNGQQRKLASLSEITAILVDHENNLWIGSEDGIYNFFQQTFEAFDFNVGAKNDNVWSINQDNQGMMWFSGYRVGLWTVDKMKNINVLNPIDLDLPQQCINQFNNQYMGSTRDLKGRLYFPIINNLLVFEGHHARGIDHQPHSALMLYNDEHKNRILSFGVNGNLEINKKDWKPKNIQGETATIVSCAELPDGNFLLGSYHGQYLYNNRTITALPDTFHYKGLISMAIDSLGHLWKGTTEGLYFSSDKGEIRIGEKTIQGHIAALYIYKNLLFIGAKQNMFMLDLNEFYQTNHSTIKVFDQNNGYLAMDGGQNGFFLDSEGFIWYPVLDKVLRFKPEEAAGMTTPQVAQAKIISITASNEKNQFITLLEPDTSLHLPADYRGLRFEFFAPCYSAPNKVVYRFQVQGLQEQWSIANSDPVAIATNLNHGTYQLQVQSSLDSINWTKTTKSIWITIAPYWWQLWWARTLEFIGAISILSLIISLFLKARQKKVIKKLMEQKRLNELRLQSVRSKHIPHFSGNALANIEHYIFNADLRAANKYLTKYSRLMNITLRDSDKASRTIALEVEYVKLYLELEKMRFGDQFSYEIIVDPSINFQKEIPNMLLHTWMENAIKHGLRNKLSEGKVKLKIEKMENNTIFISVEDNGIGRDNAKKLGTRGTGQGLQILAEQIAIYNQFNKDKVEITIYDLMSNNGTPAGTRFEMSIPAIFRFNITDY